jgi:hypothetical protein
MWITTGEAVSVERFENDLVLSSAQSSPHQW